MNLTGIILCGGKSSRMGADKGLVNYKGKPLVQYSIELLQTYCDEVLLSCNNEDYKKFNLPLIPDEIKNIGPMGGIYSTLNSSNNEYCIIIGCDVPNINHNLINLLIHSNKLKEYDFIVPIHQGKIEPLCAIYSKTVLNYIQQLIMVDNYKLQELLKKGRANFIDVQYLLDDQPDLFKNVNSLDDL